MKYIFASVVNTIAYIHSNVNYLFAVWIQLHVSTFTENTFEVDICSKYLCTVYTFEGDICSKYICRENTFGGDICLQREV